MASQGPLYDATATPVARTPTDGSFFIRNPDFWPVGASYTWAQGPQHAFGSTNPSDYLRLTNFGFTIPANATILGVTVVWGYKQASNTSIDETAQLTYNGALIGNNKALGTGLLGSPSTRTYGGSADTWGAALTPTIVNDSTFGFVAADKWGGGNGSRLYFGGAAITIDYVVVGGAPTRAMMGVGL